MVKLKIFKNNPKVTITCAMKICKSKRKGMMNVIYDDSYFGLGKTSGTGKIEK
jgi:hypothetical protein